MKKLIAIAVLMLLSLPVGAAQLTVGWTTLNSDIVKFGLTGFQVERKPALCGQGTAPFVLMGSPVVPPGNTGDTFSFVDNTVAEGNSYCYRVANKGPVNNANPTGLSAFAVGEGTVPIVLGPYPVPTKIIITFPPQ